MTKNLSIYLYGIIIIICGFFLLNSSLYPFDFMTYILGSFLIIGAILAFISALERQRKQVQFAYHEMHALAMLVYGISILLFCNSKENLILFTAFLFLFYAISEIIFCNWLLNLGQKVIYRILFFRLALGLVIGIGTVVAMNYSLYTLNIFGVFFIMVGINIVLYVPVLKFNFSEPISNNSYS